MSATDLGMSGSEQATTSPWVYETGCSILDEHGRTIKSNIAIEIRNEVAHSWLLFGEVGYPTGSAKNLALGVPRAGRYFIIFSWLSNLRLTTRCYLGKF